MEHEGDRQRWEVIQGSSSERLLQLDDRTGQCLVDPRSACIYTVRHRR